MIKTITETTKIRIRFNETDPLGIVWHGNYITYLEDGREDFGIKHGISYLDVQENGFVTPIIESSCKHKLPLKYGDVATIETTFENSPAAKMVFTYKIYTPDGKIACLGKTIQVFLDTDTNELSLTLPPFFEKWKKKTGLLK